MLRYKKLGEAWNLIRHEEQLGGLDDKTARLVKLGIAMGAMSEGAVHACVRKALDVGVTVKELEQTVALAAGTMGMPGTVALFSWVKESLADAKKKLSKSKKS